MSTTPDQQLTKRIVNAIKMEGLLTERDLKSLEDNYLNKGIRIDDWNIWVDNRIYEEDVIYGQSN
ncbi:MAG: hypothetical protein ACM3SY_22335 [Candidatus Omnitrophota bacterium]